MPGLALGGLDSGAAFNDPERKLVEQAFGRADGEVHGMIGERADFPGEPKPPPQPVAKRAVVIDRMMDVDGEIEEPAGLQHPRNLDQNLLRVACVINDIVAQHDIKAGVAEREILAPGRNRRNR